MAKPAVLRVSAEEYLREERARRHGKAELVEGEIHMMAGANRRHAVPTSSIDVALNNRLAGTPCQAVTTDLRVKAEDAEMYAYPDVVVFCDERFEDGEEDTLTSPLVIFEVLSPTTQGYDRGDKFAYYRTIPSLRHYVRVASDERTIDHCARQGEEVRLLTTLRGEDSLRLDSPRVEIPLTEIYARAGL